MASLKQEQLKEYIYTSRKVILDMLKIRGFNTDSYNSYSKDDLNNLFEQANSKMMLSEEIGALDILVEKTNENKEKEQLFVKYRLDKFKKTKTQEQQIIDIYNKSLLKSDTLIIIYLEDIYFKTNKKESNVELFIDDIYSNYEYFVQLYGIRNLLFNITDHYTIPQHILLTKKQQKDLYIKYNIKDHSNFPTIRREDPVAKFIGLRPGEICKIIRPSQTNIYSDFYRICVI